MIQIHIIICYIKISLFQPLLLSLSMEFKQMMLECRILDELNTLSKHIASNILFFLKHSDLLLLNTYLSNLYSLNSFRCLRLLLVKMVPYYFGACFWLKEKQLLLIALSPSKICQPLETIKASDDSLGLHMFLLS